MAKKPNTLSPPYNCFSVILRFHRQNYNLLGKLTVFVIEPPVYGMFKYYSYLHWLNNFCLRSLISSLVAPAWHVSQELESVEPLLLFPASFSINSFFLISFNSDFDTPTSSSNSLQSKDTPSKSLFLKDTF